MLIHGHLFLLVWWVKLNLLSLIRILGLLRNVNFFVYLSAIYIFLCELSVLHPNVDCFKACHSKRELLEDTYSYAQLCIQCIS